MLAESVESNWVQTAAVAHLRHVATTIISPSGTVLVVMATIALLLNSLSVALQTSSPEMALRFNPMNSEARVNLAYARLEKEQDAPEPATIDIINAGIVLSPIDARFYSLMGLTSEQSDDTETARQLYRHSLKILPTEILALSNTMGIAFEAGDVSATIDQLEIIGRRWGYWPAIEAVFPELLQDQFAFGMVTKRFAQDEALRTQLINALTASNEGLVYVTPVLLDWQKRKIASLDPLVNQVTSLLVSEDLGEEAYALFKRMQPKGSNESNNLVHNGEFRDPVRGNRFDWQIRNQAGVDFEFVGSDAETAQQNEGSDVQKTPLSERGLAIRFLGTPVRPGGVSQLIGMPPGNYKLSLSYSAMRLRTPKPLVLKISCRTGRTVLGEFLFDKEDVVPTETTVSFTVPKEKCSLQRISVSAQNTPNSWRQSYLYSGSLFLNRIMVEPMRTGS